ncbi:restriction endonuclease subunit S [Aliivibrio salmonicida]|uniref:restriction endonuclease subunit S n=1 Tax=Aliivibrio salmonicida TaxID=40269 RepID=UPI00406D22B5
MTGRYKAYPEYKSTDEAWLGDVPSHWTVARLKNTLRIKNGRDYKDVEVTFGGYPVYGSGGIFKRSSEYLYDGKSVLFGRKGTVDKPLLVNGKFWTVDTMFYSEIAPNMDARFIHNQAKLFPYALLSTSTALPSMTQENLLELDFVYPSFAEQQKIANFLDHETAKIDILITKQEKLIELLKEKRLATRYHAVTKGLNLNVSLIETGISWTPSAPEHWSLVPNRSVMSMRRVLVGQNYRNYQLLSLTKKGVLVRNISSGEGKQSDHLDRTQEVRDGDLVFCLFDVEETPRTVGLSHHIGMISGDYTIFECSNPSMARFVEYFYKAMDDRKLLKPLYRGLRKRIPKPGFLRVNIPIPPKEELENILQFLDDLEERIEQLMYLADKQVALLKERKAALISAAVTGKIDVRHFVSKQGQTPIEQ